MPAYKAPLRDMKFVLYEVLDFPGHYKTLPKTDEAEEADEELIDMILDSIAEFAEEVLAPLNMSGDAEGCHIKDGEVTTPKGFKEAYDTYIEGGWTSMTASPELGGQGLPSSLGAIITEILGAANWAWSMYPGLTHGAIHTVEAHASEIIKKVFMPKLVSGEWGGTMCLTEAQCGSDLAQVATRAEPMEDGNFKITGSKIFISSGDHDLTENIIHIVLARLPDAPPGTKGISLFAVPKFRVKEDGTIGERNHVDCSSIEAKMGIKGSVTAVLNFDGAKGYLLGEPNRGLNCMFTFINISRMGNAIQGITTSETAFQGSLEYARERKAMRSLTGVKCPDEPADPIIVHPDVRRMLLTQKAVAEGARSMTYDVIKLSDFLFKGTEEQRKKADKRLGLLTPILKGFLTEMGCECASLGIQVYGGHGYIKEMGMEQIYRDARISTLYEGTTGIQALDLLGRKVMLDRGHELDAFLNEIRAFCSGYGTFSKSGMRYYSKTLGKLVRRWSWATKTLMVRAMKNRDVVGSAAYDYMMFSGYVVMGWHWARMAEVAMKKLRNLEGDERHFYEAKLQTAHFYFERLLPRTRTHLRCLKADTSSLMSIEDKNFAF